MTSDWTAGHTAFTQTDRKADKNLPATMPEVPTLSLLDFVTS